MVITTLDDSKTQTRRIMKNIRVRLPATVRSDAILTMCKTHVPIECKPGIYKAAMNQNGAVSVISSDGRQLGVKPGEFHFVCPYAEGETHLGDYGDGEKRWTITPKDSRLWVKETFMRNPYVSSDYIYRATETDPDRYHTTETPWKPSIFMHRAASRITLQVTSVRVERLQDISEEDARAEGVRLNSTTHWATEARDAYKTLWERINGDGSWQLNPWVWVINFNRVRK